MNNYFQTENEDSVQNFPEQLCCKVCKSHWDLMCILKEHHQCDNMDFVSSKCNCGNKFVLKTQSNLTITNHHWAG